MHPIYIEVMMLDEAPPPDNGAFTGREPGTAASCDVLERDTEPAQLRWKC